MICDPTHFPGKKSPNIANSNSIFPGKRRGDRALILTYLHSPIAEVFPHCCLCFSILAIFREKQVIKVALKVKTLGQLLFYENSNPSSSFQCFCLLEYYLWWEFRQCSTIVGGIRAQNPPQKGHFMDAESVRKTLKTLNNHNCCSRETYHDNATQGNAWHMWQFSV